MKPLHEELKELREEQGVTLKEVANRTRIRLDFLERIETGDYKVAPMPFVRAFFREYAEVLEVDPAKAMAKLDGKLDTILEPHARPEPEPEPEPVSTPEEEAAAEPADEPDTEPEAAPAEDSEPSTETEPEPQQSLFDDTEQIGDDTDGETAGETTEPKDNLAEDSVEKDGEDTPDEPDETVAADDPEPVESAAVPEPEPAKIPEPASDTMPTAEPPARNALEIDLDDNGAAQPTVRRPVEIQEESSLSNIIFAAIVGILLIIAGVLIYLNRADMF